MATNVQKKKGDIVEVFHEPGNATRYHVVACKIALSKWCVAVPELGGCCEILEGNTIHYSYVQDKFPTRSGKSMGPVDASEIAKAICKAVPGCTYLACTDARGAYTEGA